MIYLIDDTPESYTRTYINPAEYADVLRQITSLGMSELDALKDELIAADAIFIHRSFCDAGAPGRNDVFETVVYDIAENGFSVPLVIFSDGDNDEAVFKGDSWIRQFRKQKFYENLPSFLESYRSSGKVDLKVVAHGSSYTSANATELCRSILAKVRFDEDNATVLSSKVAGSALMNLVEMSNPGIQCSYSELISIIDSGNLTNAEFRKKINEIAKSFSDYGKNIHSWR